MDPRRNPYTPNAGARPPVLVGREVQLERFDILLSRLEHGYTEQSMLATGLRGVGKTVLLAEFRDIAVERGWATVEAEITKNSPFGMKMATLMRRALFELSPRARWSERARQAAGVLKSFSVTFNADGSATAGVDVEATEGFADSGDLAGDLTDLFVAVGEVARELNKGVILLVDEVQFLSLQELEALVAALHKSVQRRLPITLVGAGLPLLPRLAGEVKSYAERLFEFPTIGPLSTEDGAAQRAFADPAAGIGVQFSDEAVARVAEYTEGYPYFIQEVGKVVWDEATSSPVELDVVELSLPLVETKLDESFFRVRAERTTDLELQYMRALAELGPEPQMAGDIAKVLHRTSENLGPTRARLIDKGLLFTPSYGLAGFTVPQFDRYMRRNHPLVIPPRKRRS